MSQPDRSIGICLHKLATKEEVVLKRVVTFSASQGRSYVLASLQDAQLVIVSDDTPVDFGQMNPLGSLIVRIADQEGGQPFDVLMARPLLVTRVMRTLDEARKLLQETLPEAEAPPVQPESAVQAVPIPVSEPAEMPLAVEAPVAVETAVATEGLATDAATVAGDAGQAGEVAYHHTALVVDDSAAIRKQLEIELRQAGIRADFAESGEQAMEKVVAYDYDLIFLDIIMPGIDGYETCRQMRLRREMKKTPIIMLSAKTSPLDEVQGVIAGASTYLTKPVKSEQLQKTLKRVSMWLDNFQ